MLTPAACTARLRLHQKQAPAYFTSHTAHCALHTAHYILRTAHYTQRTIDALTLHHELENTSFPRPELLRPVAGAKHLHSVHFTLFYSTLLRCSALFFYCNILYHTVLHCTILYCTHCTVLQVLYCISFVY